MTFRRQSLAIPKPVAENYDIPSGVSCVQVYVPDSLEHIALLQGLMAILTNEYAWQDDDPDIRYTYSKLWNDAFVATDWANCGGNAGMLNIDLFCHNATPLAGVGTLTYNTNTGLPFGYAISTQNITLYGMEQPCWFAAGEYDYVGWSSLTTQGGNTSVALTDAGGVVDTIITSINQSGTFGTRVKSTGTFTVPDDGFYKIVAGNVSVAAGFQANWISHHIRQTS